MKLLLSPKYPKPSNWRFPLSTQNRLHLTQNLPNYGQRNKRPFECSSEPLIRLVCGMERGDNVLETIFEDENLEDVEMLDVEEGELVEVSTEAEHGESNAGIEVKVGNSEGCTNNPGEKKNKKKKKKSKRKRGNSGPNVTNINRFVLDVCRRLKERKSYLVWAAVGCLGVSALGDLVTEVEAIQACGGQKTADGRRFRTGGGILWSVLKVRDPNAYKEIMRRGKEFEKQFKPQNVNLDTIHNKENSSQTTGEVVDGLQEASHQESQLRQNTSERNRVSVHERVRIPVAYDDLLDGENPGDGGASVA
ncbi:uncharacterized protein [Coffea arabica]|uniref:Phosphorylated adapter RNA export protein n=1 Tax=Coffea arabica TaxID=13443 RepID=A0ABM4VFT0_COFAR